MIGIKDHRIANLEKDIEVLKDEKKRILESAGSKEKAELAAQKAELESLYSAS